MATRMRFNLHPGLYTVTVCPGPLYDDGQAMATIHGREILLAGDMPPHDRLEAVVDQLIVAREWHHGEMGRRSLRAFIVEIHRQLVGQGGEPALMRLRPAPPRMRVAA